MHNHCILDHLRLGVGKHLSSEGQMETFWDDGNVLKIYLGGSYIGSHINQSLLENILNQWILL